MKRYKIEVMVRITEVDGNRTYPQELRPESSITTSTVVEVGNLTEIGKVLEQVDSIGKADDR